MEDQDTRRSSGSEALMQACFGLICPGQHPRPTESAWSPLQRAAQGGDCGLTPYAAAAVQSLSHVPPLAAPRTAARQAPLSSTIS